MEKLIVIGFTVILLVLSIPFHELFHVLFIRCLGGEGKLKITWFSFKRLEIEGSVESEDGIFHFPKLYRWTNHFRLFGFFLGLSGGLGTATVLTIIAFLFLVFLIPPPVWQSFLFVAIIQLVKGVAEAIKLSKTIELV